MKLGNLTKVTCKKDLLFHLRNNKLVGYKKNKTYLKIDEDWDDDDKFIYVYYNDLEDNGTRFYINDKFKTDYKYSDYFYTEKELRNLKLKKLNESR